MLERVLGRWHDLPQLDPVDNPDHADEEERTRHAEAEPPGKRRWQDVGDADALDDQHAVENGDLAGQNTELFNEQRAAHRRSGAANIKPTPDVAPDIHRGTRSIIRPSYPRGANC